MVRAAQQDPPSAGLVAACESPELFGVELTPKQRQLLAAVEAGLLLHLWALGRRSGKTLLGALVALWLLLLRPDLREHVRTRERIFAVCVATNARQARLFVEAARTIVEGSPLLAPLVVSVTEDEIVFKNRGVLAAFPCTSRGGRGWPIAYLLLDEAAHFLDTDGNASAEPVFRSLVPSTAQFGDAARVIVSSSPFGTEGFFAETFRAVEQGELPGCLAQHSTLDMRPGFASAALALERKRDPEGFRSEYMAEFVPAGGAYLDAGRIADAVGREHELRPGEVVEAVAAADLAFVSDASALCIVGRDRERPERLRLVLARSWKPEAKLGFGGTLDEIAHLCRAYGVTRIHIDQFSATAATEHLARHGIHSTTTPTSAASKSEMFASLKTRLYGGGLDLYQQPDLLAELRRIETVTTPGQANVRIRRLGTSHGDLATALALACSQFGSVRRPMRSHNPNRYFPNIFDRTGSRFSDEVFA
jgi:hypothetical protein